MTGPRLPHGYSNATWIADGRVGKRFAGIDAPKRYAAEIEGLRRAAAVLPVPRLLAVDEQGHQLTLSMLPGRPGQELLDAGYGLQVLRATGWALTRLHHRLPGLVHGDFGPQNLLIDASAWRVSGVLDWEFCHDGDPIEDLAWAEWIVRMHHPRSVTALPALFQAYGTEPPWPRRQAAMIDKCAELEQICRDRGADDAVALWQERADRTRRWREPG